jgi:hypothetical protein
VWLHRLPLLLPNLTRAVFLWLLVHAGLWATTPGSLSEMLNLTPSAALIAAAVTASLAHVDAHVMHEPVFYANVGVPRWTPALTAFVTALTLDILLAVGV